MHIVAINGSHRGDSGYTRFLLDRLFLGASESGAECRVMTLARLKVNRCLGCGKCHTSDHHLRCVYEGKDDVSMVFRAMAEADIVVYATPVYIFNMSGLLKTFLDRMYGTGDVYDMKMTKSGLMFHHIDHDICSKPFVSLICCDNLDAETPMNVRSYFRTFSRFMDAPQVGELVRNGGRLTGHGKNPDMENRFHRIHAVYEAYVQAGRELVQQGRISSSTQRKACQEIVPIPFFRLLKRFTFMKKQVIKKARIVMHGGARQREDSPQSSG